MFGLISRELDMRHDKRERIVKISRDITIGQDHCIVLVNLHLLPREQEDHLRPAPDP